MSTVPSISLSDYLTSSWQGDNAYDGLDVVIETIAVSALEIQEKVMGAATIDVLGDAGEVNVQGEIVQYLDTIASDSLIQALTDCGRVAAIGSEEVDDGILVGDSDLHNYIVMMDPLDGSSNIDVAVSIGSIFGIWKREIQAPLTIQSLLRPGREQVASAYVIYGSSTVLVLAFEGCVSGFTLNPASGMFELTHPDIKIPGKCEYYSLNEGNLNKWDNLTQKAVEILRNDYSLRYVGSLVADFHRNLLKGGIFLYPADAKSPNGKLRLMYEANPLGYIAVQAGGMASSGQETILNIPPDKIHERVPLIVGNSDVVQKTLNIIQG